MSRNTSDRCRVCGAVGSLSREHDIPESAGNSGETSVHSLNSIARGWSRGELFQNGLTRSTLCVECNHACGLHYVRQFAQWTLQAAAYRARLNRESRVLLPFSVLPLAVAKQIAVMTLAMSPAGSIDLPHFLDLRRFVLSPSRRSDFDSFRFYAYFHYGDPTFEGAFYALDTSGGPCPQIYCHVGREPLGYVVTGNDAASLRWAGRLRLCDLTGFARRAHNVIAVEHLLLPCMTGELPFRPLRNRGGSS